MTRRHGKIRRYSLIIDIINKGNAPSFKDIKKHLAHHGFELSQRTIERDLEQIRYEFGLDIVFSWEHKGYIIDKENSENVDSFFRFIEMANTSEILQESLSVNKASFNNILFDKGSNLKGTENLGPLIRAIKENKKAVFNHFSFKTQLEKPYCIEPYLLKEYQHRWYVIGWVEDRQMMLTFGIDRIEDLEIKTETFKPDKSKNPKDLFNHTIGIIHSVHPVQDVILSFTPQQGMYVKTLPLHHSQKILVDNDAECRISLYVAPNYELNQLILKHGDTVEVKQPKWLAIEIKETIERMLKKYS